MKKPRPTERFLSRKRTARVMARRHGRKQLRQHRAERLQSGPIAEPYHSKILQEFRRAVPRKTSAAYRIAQVTVPATFSVIREPALVLQTIAELLAKTRNTGVREVSINHSKLVTYDLAAEEIFDLVVDELLKERRADGMKMNVRGTYPPSEDCRRFLKAIGIIKNLKMEHEYLTASETGQLEVFELRRGSQVGTSNLAAADSKSQHVKEFADFVNRCLNRNGRTLKPDALSRLCSYTGEVIANAEEHSGSREWFIAGYLDNFVAPHVCEITILSFGKTIASTFAELPASSYPRMQVEKYVRTHKRKGFFTPRYRETDLYTLASLQGGVSSKNRTAADTRGQGTIDLIDFFERVSSECAKGGVGSTEMAILSGSSHIRFDGTYKLGQDSTGRRVIAFNEQNLLSEAPDPKYVKNLPDVAFPGTVISIRFSLQQSQITVTPNEPGQPHNSAET